MLKEIVQYKQQVVTELKKTVDFKQLIQAGAHYQRQSFYKSLSKEGLSLIAELKKGSPSKGILRQDFNPLLIATQYLNYNPSAFSVLTDEKFFFGSNEYLKQIKEKFEIPVLRKDFIIDDLQVYESYSIGADAILLIAEILEEDTLHRLYNLSKSLGMDVLLELHSADQIRKLDGLDVDILGINNRDLKTFEVDINNCVNIRSKLQRKFPKALFVAESGVLRKADYRFVKASSFDAVLVGEGLIKGNIIDN
jgi:indole-3-glycerol phosphate synthase